MPACQGSAILRAIDQAIADADGSPTTLGEALLAPTRIYVRPVLDLLAGGGIDGLAHITGGGLTENIVRVLPDGLGLRIDTSAWQRPEVFGWLQREGNIAEAEMLRTFNCGIGMVVCVPPEQADEAAREAMSPKWIAPVVTWLASEHSRGVTGRVIEAVGELLGEPAVLYKEKINYKYPGGGGYAAHQEAVVVVLAAQPAVAVELLGQVDLVARAAELGGPV